MTKVRENLIDRMINIYGFENKLVVAFAAMCEEWADNDWNDTMLTILVDAHEVEPIYEDEDEED